MYTKEIAAAVRKELKEQLPEWKFSVTFDSYSGGSSIDLALTSGPEDVGATYAQLNHYTLLSNDIDNKRDVRYHCNGAVLTKTGWEVMRQATEILAKYHWDRSEPQVDYFSCNFYMHVSIGKWNREYVILKGKK